MGVPATHIPTLQRTAQSRQRPARSQDSLWQGPLATAFLSGPSEPRRGRPATARPQHRQRRGHPAGSNRRAAQLMRLGPGSSWDTHRPQRTLAISVQCHQSNKLERKTAKIRVGIANGTAVVASPSSTLSPLLPAPMPLLALPHPRQEPHGLQRGEGQTSAPGGEHPRSARQLGLASSAGVHLGVLLDTRLNQQGAWAALVNGVLGCMRPGATIPPCPITIHPHNQLYPLLFIHSLPVLEDPKEVSPEPCLPQAKQAQFPQPFLTGEVLQPSDHLRGPSLDSFRELCVFLVLGAPGLDAVLQMGPHKS